MFTGTSMTGVGVVISILAFIAKYFQLDLDEGVITEGVSSIVQGVAFILVVWGQVRRKDLDWGLKRKV